MADITSPKWNRAKRYAVAPAMVALALACRLMLNPILQDASPFMYFYLAVIVSALLGGLGPGLLATCLSWSAVEYFLIPPIGSLMPANLQVVIQGLSFLLLCGVISTIVARLRREQRRAEQATEEVRANEIHFRTMADLLPQLAWSARPDGYIYWYNKRCYEYTGTTLEQMEGWGWDIVIDPGALPQVLEQWKRSIATGEPFEMVFPLRRSDGQFRLFLTRILPLKDERGRVTQWFGTNTDVDDLKREEERLVESERLRESERRLTDIINFLPDATFALDNTGKITAWNKAMEALTATPAADVLGKGNHEYTYRLYGKRIPCLADEVLGCDQTGWTFLNIMREIDAIKAETYVPHLRPGGVWLSIRVAPIYDTQGKIIGVIDSCRDITERKQMEEILRESERRYRALTAASSQVLYRMSPDWSEMRQLQGGGFLADMEQPSCAWLQDYIPPDEQGLVREAISKAVSSGSVYELEHRVCRKDGTIGWTLSRAVPLRNEAGEISEWFGAATDVTERKRAEEALHAANERLREADRRKDEFMAMLAHELRNPLAPIRYAAQVLNVSCPGNAHLQEQRNVIDRQVSHMGRLLDDLLEVSRITRGKITLKREIVDLRTVARQALDSMRPMITGRGQHLRYEEPSSPLLVNGDPTRLEQIIRNMLHNANKYTEAGGCIKLSLELEECGCAHQFCERNQAQGPRKPGTGTKSREQRFRASPLVSLGFRKTDEHPEDGGENEHETGWQAGIRVLDSGIGIAPEILPRVFEAFVQGEQGLARSQGGLGIGLAMVKNLVQMHGGRVEAHSAGAHQGSEFTVHLPLAAAGMSETHGTFAPEEPTPEAPHKARRLLVVDDNEDAAASLSELLELWGHEIQTAHDGRHALAAARKWQPEIIILDIGLPGMDGYEVARHLREDPATAKTYLVALTGYGQDEDRQRAHEAGFDRHMTKPVELEQLQKLIQEAQAI